METANNLHNLAVSLESELEVQLAAHIESRFSDPTEIWRLGEAFSRDGYVKISDLVPTEVLTRILQETLFLLDNHSRRKDVLIKHTGDTKRAMSNVHQPAIAQHGSLIPAIYRSAAIKGLLGKLAKDQIVSCPWEQEEFIITRQERVGDTHGWHWGDYPYTVIWVLEAPAIDAGGMLQCIPHTVWDKNSPRIHEHLVEHPIKTFTHKTGDIYFLKSDTTLHRTVPLIKDVTRIILNTCWDSGTRPNLAADHETMIELFE